MRRTDELSERERQVLDLVRLGLTNEEIARRLGISPAGAKYHVSQILSKLGVSSREEAVALALEERRPWWTRVLAWGLAAKVAGAAVVVAALGGIGVLVYGLAATGGTGEDDGSSPATTAAPVATAAPSVAIGSYGDPYSAGSFLAELDVTVRNADVDWFLANTAFPDLPCDQQGAFPSAAPACAGLPPGSVVPGVTVGVLQSEGFATDREGYAALIRDYMTNFDSAASDEYGDGRPRLYAWGIRSAEFGKDSSLPAYVTAIVTRIVGAETGEGAPSPTFPPAGRSVILFDAGYDGNGWRIQHLSIGGGRLDPLAVAQMLDPAGRGAPDGARLWEFWSPWERSRAVEIGASPPPGWQRFDGVTFSFDYPSDWFIGESVLPYFNEDRGDENLVLSNFDPASAPPAESLSPGAIKMDFSSFPLAVGPTPTVDPGYQELEISNHSGARFLLKKLEEGPWHIWGLAEFGGYFFFVSVLMEADEPPLDIIQPILSNWELRLPE